MRNRYLLIISAFCLMISSTACDRERNDKGYEYFPDMAHSLAYETYAPNPNLVGGESMLLPAENTVPIEMIPYRYPATPEGRIQAASELVNPLEMNESALVRGKEQYVIFCQHCHGVKGDGEGFLFTSGKYTFRPASLVNDKMKAANEADIYHVITVGYQLMGPHGHMILPNDRWNIAMFVKSELQK